MTSKETLERVKRSTVALAFLPPEPSADPKIAPFVIIGSGFCIDESGTVVTCEHVVNAFLARDFRQLIAEVPPEDQTKDLWPLRNIQMMIPHALFFFTDKSPEHLYVLPVPVEFGMAKMDYDIGLLRLRKHPAFTTFPFLEIESFEELYEGMEVATCGFPLGNDLQTQLGTMTSSFTRGILSSIIPAPNTIPKYVTGFQLDLAATNGNSGGPVFNWATGKVLGVLQGAPVHGKNAPVAGLAKAESIYLILNDGALERFRAGPPNLSKL